MADIGRATVHWLTATALPLWASAGWDTERAAFHERLDAHGHPIINTPQRLMVQARQIAVYAMASQLGWSPDGARLARDACRSMARRYWRADGRPGWVMAVDRSGDIVDPARDLYAHAFVLYALAWMARVGPDPAPALELADATLAFLDENLCDRADLGYFESGDRAPGFRRQNPHMHLLEALLELSEIAPGRGYLERADSLVALLGARFIDPRTGALLEFFERDWQPLPGDRGQVFEPGHHFEWVWLLHRHARLRGTPVIPEAGLLCTLAMQHGFAAGGAVYDEVHRDGHVIKRSHRSWPLAEGVKAAAALFEDGDLAARALADRLLTTLTAEFLAPAYPGGWIDNIEPDGRFLGAYMSASTLYHLTLAIAEYQRVFLTASQV